MYNLFPNRNYAFRICLATVVFVTVGLISASKANAQCITCTQSVSLPAWSNGTINVTQNNTCLSPTGSSAYFDGTINVGSRSDAFLCIGSGITFGPNARFISVNPNYTINNYGTYMPDISLDNKIMTFNNYGSVTGTINLSHTSSAFTNAGTGTLAFGSSISLPSGTFINNGNISNNTITVNGGLLSNNGNLAMATLNLSSGTLISNTGASLYINTNSFSPTGGTLTSNGTFKMESAFTPSGGAISLNGANTFNSNVTIGTSNSSNTVTFGGPTTISTLTVNKATAIFNGALTVAGGVAVTGPTATLTLNSGAQVPGGQFTVASGSTVNVQGSLEVNAGQIVNSGTIKVPDPSTSTCNTICAGTGIINNSLLTAPVASPLKLCKAATGTGTQNANVSISEAPANQPTGLTLTVNTDKRFVTVNFTAATGTPSAAGYVVIRKLNSPISATNYPRATQNPVVGTYQNAAKTVAYLIASNTTFTDQVDSCGTYYYAVISSNSATSINCASYTRSPANVNSVATANGIFRPIAYTNALYCRACTTEAAIITGGTGGTFSASRPGLTINPSTGVVNPASITDTGLTTISYTVPAARGCSNTASTATVRFAGASLPYVWAGGTTNPMNVSSNWTPARGSIGPCDILIIKNGGNVTLSQAQAQTFRRLVVTGNTQLNLTAAAAANLTLTGESNLALVVDQGSSLTLNSANLTLTLGNSTRAEISGTLNLIAGQIMAGTSNRFVFASSLATFTPLTRTAGTLSVNNTTHLQFGKSGATAMTNFTLPNDVFAGTTPTVRNLDMQVATARIALGNQSLTITDTLARSSGAGVFALNGQTLTLNGLTSGTPTIDGSAAGSRLVLQGNRNVSGLRFAPATLNALTLNRTYASAITLPVGSDLSINGGITFTKGIVATGSQKITLATTSAMSDESDSSFVLGTLEQTRNVVQAVRQSFSNMRLAVTALGAAPGLTTVSRQNTNRAAIGTGQGVQNRYVIATTVNTGLNATLEVKLLNTELAGAGAGILIFFRSPTNSPPWQPFYATQRNPAALTYTQTGINAFSTWTLGEETIMPLPITLASFTGTPQNRGRVNLKWATLSEQNNLGFTLLRSEDGTSYDSIGFVKSQGDATTERTYTFADYNAPQAAYYRLRQTDFNGTAFTSNPIRVVSKAGVKGEKLVTLVSNPLTDNSATLAFNGMQRMRYNVTLRNIQGQVLYNRAITLMPGNHHIVGLPELAPGLYQLELTPEGDAKEVLKIVRQ